VRINNTGKKRRRKKPEDEAQCIRRRLLLPPEKLPTHLKALEAPRVGAPSGTGTVFVFSTTTTTTTTTCLRGLSKVTQKADFCPLSPDTVK